MNRRFTISVHRGVVGSPGFEGRGEHLDWFFQISADTNAPLLTFTTPLEIPQSCEFAALRLPDHRGRYLDYDGDVSGNRGSVQRLVTGRYVLLESIAERSEITVESAVVADTLPIPHDAEYARKLSHAIQTKLVFLVS